MQWGRAEGISFALLTASVALSALAAGAVHTVTLLVVGALICTGCVPLLRGLHFNALSWVLSLLAAACLLQALPLPIRLVDLLSPNGADVWQRSADALGQHWTHVSLSLAPRASLIEALKFSSYALVVALSATLAQKRGPWPLLMALVGSGVAVSLVTLFTLFAQPSTLFGLYRPQFAERALPILNPNTLAAYLNLACFLGLALMLRAKRGQETLLWGSSVTLCLSASSLLASRGALLSGVLGLLVCALWLWRGQRHSGRSLLGSTRVLAALAGVTAAGVLLVLGAQARTWSELGSHSLVKLAVFRGTLRLIGDFPLFGAGRGAFETAFPPYRPAEARLYTPNLVFTHPENIFLQWASEWGLPLTLLAVLGGVWALRGRTLTQANPRSRGVALIGLLVVLLHTQFDLGSEVPALMLACCVVLGAMYAQPPLAEPGLVRSPRGRLWLGVVVTLILLVAMLHPHRPIELRQTLFDRLRAVSSAAEQAAVGEEVVAALKQYPGDPYLLMLASHAWQGRDEARSFRLASRVLERDPDHGPAHLRIAEVLRERGAVAQAMLELSFAVRSWPQLAEQAAERALAFSDDPQMIARAAPEGGDGVRVLQRAIQLAHGPLEAQLNAQLQLRQDAESSEP